LPDVDRWIGGEPVVDLRDRTEGALTGEAYLVASLARLLDPSVDRQPGPERVDRTLARDGAAGQFVGKPQPARRRDHDGLDGISDFRMDVAVRIGQLRDVDGGFALPADVDEGQ